MFSKLFMVFVSGFFLVPMSAMAQIAEVRVGIAEFDERTLNLPGALQFADENSIALSGEILFEEPEFLKWALSPQPYIGGTLNLEGNTSFGGAGLLWRQTFGKKLYADYAFGLAIHNGTTEITPSAEVQALFSNPNITPDNVTPQQLALANTFFDRFDNEIEFGSRVLFRLQGTIGYNVNEDWAGEVYIEHLSNGRVFADTINDGVNILGVRAARKF